MTSLESEVMLCGRCAPDTPVPMMSSRLEMSAGGESRPGAVKKWSGVERDVTLLPEARRPEWSAQLSGALQGRGLADAEERVILDKAMGTTFLGLRN